ncbi:MAG: hypothetical protein V3W41_04710 [Planctomycetota bacterium]
MTEANQSFGKVAVRRYGEVSSRRPMVVLHGGPGPGAAGDVADLACLLNALREFLNRSE